jgi:hypothetical protein
MKKHVVSYFSFAIKLVFAQGDNYTEMKDNVLFI